MCVSGLGCFRALASRRLWPLGERLEAMNGSRHNQARGRWRAGSPDRPTWALLECRIPQLSRPRPVEAMRRRMLVAVPRVRIIQKDGVAQHGWPTVAHHTHTHSQQRSAGLAQNPIDTPSFAGYAHRAEATIGISPEHRAVLPFRSRLPGPCRLRLSRCLKPARAHLSLPTTNNLSFHHSLSYTSPTHPTSLVLCSLPSLACIFDSPFDFDYPPRFGTRKVDPSPIRLLINVSSVPYDSPTDDDAPGRQPDRPRDCHFTPSLA